MVLMTPVTVRSAIGDHDPRRILAPLFTRIQNR